MITFNLAAWTFAYDGNGRTHCHVTGHPHCRGQKNLPPEDGRRRASLQAAIGEGRPIQIRTHLADAGVLA